MSEICIDCGKEKKKNRSLRCRSCAAKHCHSSSQFQKIYFSNEEKIQMGKLYKGGMILREIGKIFGCSYSIIGGILILELGIIKYKKYAREHSLKISIENWKRASKLPRSEKQLKNSKKAVKKMHNVNAKNHIWVSNPEHRFFLMSLSKMFFLKDIERQFYLKGLNHAFDFAIPSQKLLFEVDGDYWHSQNPERDLEIDNFAKSAGWSIFRFNDAKLKELEII